MKRSTNEVVPISTDVSSVFALTYMYYSVLGTVIALFVGTLVSYATQSDEDQFETKLLHPYVLRLARFWKIPLRNTKENSASTFSIASCATTATTTAENPPIKGINPTQAKSEVYITMSPHVT